jgi:hypothetical protein
VSETELIVEGEPWTGLVVAALWPPGPSNVGLVRAEDWCRLGKTVVLWRGPYKPDETVARRRLTELTCRSVLVDENGFYICVPDPDPGRERFYPCQEISEEFAQTVKDAAEKMLGIMANERAAESQSYTDSEETAEEFGPDVYAIATFGDEVAVNGESGYQKVKPPRRWKKLDRGGRIPGGLEATFEKDELAKQLAEDLTWELKVSVDPTTVLRVLDKEYGKSEYIAWTSDSGDSEIWVSPKAWRKWEKEQEEEEKRHQAAELKQRQKAHREAEERRQKEEAERRERIKRGGFPFPTDWSPRGSEP